METFRIWVRPAVVAALWIAATSFTLAELSTVVPSLQSASAGRPRQREARPQAVLRARVQPGTRLVAAP